MLETHKAFDDPAAVGFGYAGPAIGDAEHDALAVIAGAHNNLRGLAIGLAVRLGIFDGVVDQIRQRLSDQFAVAANRSGVRRFDRERQPFLVGQRLVQLRDIAGDLGGIEFRHVVSRLPGFGPRDHQQRVESADQIVGFRDGRLEHGPVIGSSTWRRATLLRSDCAAASAAS